MSAKFLLSKSLFNNRIAKILAVFLVTLVAIVGVNSREVQGASLPCTGDGIYLYEGTNYEGACWNFTESQSDLGALGFNDQASSLRFVGSFAPWYYQVTLCEHANFEGDCSPFFIGDDPNLGDNNIGHDRTSSIHIEPLTPTNSLHTLTYNVQFLPQIFFAEDTHDGCCEDIPGRISKLAERIIAAEYDIIVLNEAFTGDVQDGLEERLREYYPHYIKYIDDNEFNEDQDSGLMLFSRYPFVPIENDTYKADDVTAYNGQLGYWSDIAFIEYEERRLPPEYDFCYPDGTCIPHPACSGSDCRADKGVAYVPIQNPYNNHIYHFVFTHLQAGESNDADTIEAAIRDIQLQAVEDLISTVIIGEQSGTERPVREEDILFMGDLNFDGDFSKPPKQREEWEKHFNTPYTFFTSFLHDIWAREMQTDISPEHRDRGLTSDLHGGPVEGLGSNEAGEDKNDKWGDSRAVTALATGNIDGIAGDEVVVGRNSGDNMRWAVYRFDPAINKMSLLGSEQGHGWGDSRAVTALAAGDVDADGDDEVVVGRNSGDGMRWAVYRYNAATGSMESFHSESDWGDSRAVTALATGNIDGIAGDEVVVGRNSGDNMRWAVYRYNAATGSMESFHSESDWGDSRAVTALATGNIDGIAGDELVLGRNEGDGMRWAVYRYNAATDSMEQFYSESDWGGSRGIRALAAGDVDGDGRDEVAVGRNTDDNMRWAVYRFNPDTETMELLGSEKGDGWGSSRFVTALAAGDMNGDGRDEIAVGRSAGDNMRWAVYHYHPSFDDMVLLSETQGQGWGDDRGITALVMGDINNSSGQELVLGRNPGGNMRWAVYRLTDLFRRVQTQKRLDYILRNMPPLNSSAEPLCVQHVAVAHNLRHGPPMTEAAFGEAGHQDLSDHYGLNADINLQADLCSPAQAMDNPELDSFIEGRITHPGSVQWYYFDSPGTYSIVIQSDGPVDHHVYHSTDLSTPFFRPNDVGDTLGWTYPISEGPFYIKVFSRDRSWHNGSYRLLVHKHSGESKEESIILHPNLPLTYDLSNLPEDSAAVWFRINTEAPVSGLAQNLKFFARQTGEPVGDITIELRAEDGSTVLASSMDSNPEILRSEVADNNAELYLVVRPGIGIHSLQVGWETNMTILHGTLPYPLKLQADKQTSDEFGIGEDDDDVKITIQADGVLVVDSVNLGDFDEGQIRGLGDIFTAIGYLEELDIKLVEADAFLQGGDDILTGTLQPLPVEISNINPGRFSLTGEGGIYDLFFNRSHGLVQASPGRLIFVDAGPDQTVFEDDLVTLEASFIDLAPSASYTATIDWGDGTSEAGTVSQINGSGVINAEHIYALPERYTVTVTVVDSEDNEGVDTSLYTVVHGFLKLGVFGQGNLGNSVAVGSQANMEGDAGGNGAIELGRYASIAGNLLSIHASVQLLQGTAVQGDITATRDIELETDTRVEGNLLSGRNIQLVAGSFVSGSVTAARSVELRPGATVIGPVQSGANVPPIPSITPVTFSNSVSDQDIYVATGETIALAPGSYRQLLAGSTVTLTFSSGDYAFENMMVGQGTKINLDLQQGPIVIRILNNLRLNNDVQMVVNSTTGDAADVIFLVEGRRISLGARGSYLGTYLAPQAIVELGRDSTLEGALYGERVSVVRGARLTEHPAFDLFISLFLPLE